MTIKCVWEHNANDTLLYCIDFIGAYTRGESLDVAVSKMTSEISSYCNWIGKDYTSDITIDIVEEHSTELCVKDADSETIFESEKEKLTFDEYQKLKDLALKSAKDFLLLYNSISEKDKSFLPERKTFYGAIPRTAEEMYQHTKNVNKYYFGEIGIEADNNGDIYDCRARGFEILEEIPNFLDNPVITGSYGEVWSLKKVIRRFIWHDRIHAKAMWRMANRTFGEAKNPFCF